MSNANVAASLVPEDVKFSKSERTIPEHIVLCKTCEGVGQINGKRCLMCGGSGRVVVKCEVVKYIAPYVPKINNK